MRESDNVALRDIKLGYSNVFWYCGGLRSWIEAEQQVQQPAAVRCVIIRFRVLQ
jgi:hypothetical protein